MAVTLAVLVGVAVLGPPLVLCVITFLVYLAADISDFLQDLPF